MRVELAWVGASFLLGLWLRLRHPAIAEFKYDEVHILDLAHSLLEGGRLALTGSVGSTGLPNPPLAVYLHAIPLAVSPDPRVAVLFMGTLSALAIPALYFALRPYLPRAAVLGAVLLLAVNPWAVLFGRKLGTHIFPLFAVLALWLVVRAAARPPSFARSAWAGAGLAAFFHTYLLAALPAAAGLLTLVVWRRAAAALLLGGLLVLPYAWAVGGLSGLQGRDAPLHPEALQLLAMATSGSGVEALYAGGPSVLGRLLLPVFGGLLVLGVAVALRRFRHAPYLALSLWVLVPALLLLVGGRPVYLHYALAVLPVNLVLAALGLWLLVPRYTLPAAALLALPLAWSSYHTVNAVATPNPGHPYGPTLSAWREALRPLLEGRPGGPVFIFSPDAQPDFQGKPAALRYLLRPAYDVRFLDVAAPHPFLVLRREPSRYIVVGEAPELLAEWSRREGSSDFPALVRMTAPTAEEVLARMTPVQARFANAAVLAGVRLGCAGDQIVLDELWDLSVVPERFQARQYSVFNHLVDGSGELIAQADGLSLPAESWREGDWLLQRYRLPKPPGQWELRTGLYSLVDLQRERIAAGDHVTIAKDAC